MKKKIRSASKRKHSARGGKAKASSKVPRKRLSAIYKELLGMREELVKTVRNQKIPDTSMETGDSIDQASQSIEKELLFELSDNERVTLDQVEAALRKIEKGSYGLCEACRKPISAQRIKALPFARYCIVCQSSAETSVVPESVEVGDFRGLGEETGREG